MGSFEDRYRYCPQCRCEYRPGFDVCSDCGVDLVDEPPPDETAPEGQRQPDFEALASAVGPDPVAVYVTTSEIDAHVVRGALVDAGIPSAVWASGHMGYYGHATRLVPFPNRVMVHKEDEAEARELLAAHFGDEVEEPAE